MDFYRIAQLFPSNTLSSCTNFSSEQLIQEGRWEIATSEEPYPSRHQNVTDRKFMFYDRKLSKSSDFCYLETGLYPSITDAVEAMNTLIQEKHNDNETCIAIKMSRRTQKVKIYLAREKFGLVFFNTYMGHTFRCNFDNEFGVRLRGKIPHKLEFAFDIACLHSLMIYTHLVEYNIVFDTKGALLRCFPPISKLKAGDNITTRQFIKSQTFSNL